MCADGYGVFYNFEPNQLWIWITAFRSSFETSVEKLWRELDRAFVDIAQLTIKGLTEAKL